MMSKALWAGLVLAVGAGGAAWWWKQQGGEATQAAAAAASAASAPRPPQVVSVFAAAARDLPVTLDVAGTAVALESVDLRSQITGTVADVFVADGQFVRRGQMLFRLDDRADRAALERARATLLRDQATLADLERQWKRAQELRAQNFIAQSAADTVLSQVEAQRAAVASSQAALRAAEVQLSLNTIAAPFSGRTGAVNVNRGSLVTPNNLVMVNIAQVNPIGVAFAVPEAQLGVLLRSVVPSTAGTERAAEAAAAEAAAEPAAGGRRGRGGAASGPAAAQRPASAPRPPAARPGPAPEPATFTVLLPAAERGGRGGPPAGASGAATSTGPMAASGAAGAGRPGAAEPIPGKIVFVDNSVDTTTGTIKVRGEVPNERRALWPGQYVTVRLNLRTLKDAVVVPQAAFIIRGQERSVYIAREDNTAELRPVQLRYPAGEFAAVDGVRIGEKVVVEGKQNLRPGSALRATPYVGGRRGTGAGPGTGAGSAASGAAPSASGAGGGLPPGAQP